MPGPEGRTTTSDLERLGRVLGRSGDPDNPDAETIRDLVRSVEKIAVVGLSRDPAKAARRVPSYLAVNGYDVIPVNPNAEQILGKPSRDRLEDLDEPVDLVLVFRPSDEAGEVIRSAAAREEEPAIWLQEGLRSDDEARKAREAGRTVVQDLCLYKVHRALGEPPRA